VPPDIKAALNKLVGKWSQETVVDGKTALADLIVKWTGNESVIISHWSGTDFDTGGKLRAMYIAVSAQFSGFNGRGRGGNISAVRGEETELGRMKYVTLPGTPNGLLVNNIDTPDPDHNGLWKVSYVFEETPHALSRVVFVRRTDAERAKAAIETLIDWTLPPAEVIAQLRREGWTPQSLTQRMAESVQW
jgi:hypothetical protein